MPDLLLELFSEEIPARMQRQAAEDLRRLVTNALVDRNLTYEGAQAFVTPRRLALHVVGLPAAQPTLREERKGPRVGAPDAAIQGFLKSAGLQRIADATVERDPKKGEFYVAVVQKPGRPTMDALAEIIPAIVRSFPWPKSMRWGASSTKPDALRWVRPLRGIVCTLSIPHDATEIVPFEVDGRRAGAVTFGHRFMAPEPITVRRYEDYADALQKAKVVLDADRRKAIILADAKNLAFAQGLELVEDEGLLEEVAGLVEWPVALMGEFEPAFLDIPPEVIRATIRANQKCFVLRDGEGKLANRFILVANLIASDGGAAIAAGNGRVVRARLADARHFFLTDLNDLPDYRDKAAKPLDQRLAKLEALGIIFHEKLGTQVERIERIETLARELAPEVGADVELAARAAILAKADLVTEMVGEFPELQGLMGRYYAVAQGEEASVAAAIEEHYKPQGPNDRIPTSPVSIAVALADKLDTLAAFWAIDEKPTGSKDPYALRRAALGVIRIVLENGLRLPLTPPLTAAAWGALLDIEFAREDEAGSVVQSLEKRGFPKGPELDEIVGAVSRAARRAPSPRRRAASRDHGEPHRLLRRPAESVSPRQGRALRPHRRGVRSPRPGRPFDDRLAGRGAGKTARQRGRQEPARRLPPRRQHSARRGEEGRRGGLFRPARSGRPRAAGGKEPRRCARRGGRRGARADWPRGLRRRDAGARHAARAGRRLLPRRHRQRRRSLVAPQPPEALGRIARGGARGRGLFQGGGVALGPKGAPEGAFSPAPLRRFSARLTAGPKNFRGLEPRLASTQKSALEAPFGLSAYLHLSEFQQLFPNDAACAAYLGRARGPNGFVCPHCGLIADPFRHCHPTGCFWSAVRAAAKPASWSVLSWNEVRRRRNGEANDEVREEAKTRHKRQSLFPKREQSILNLRSSSTEAERYETRPSFRLSVERADDHLAFELLIEAT